MTSLYRPNKSKRTPRLRKMFPFGQWRWICYGLGAYGVGVTEREAYRSWAEDLEQWAQVGLIRQR